MTPDHLAKLENALRTSAGIPETTRQELLEIVAGLKAEVSSVTPGAQPPSSTLQVAHALSSSVRQI